MEECRTRFVRGGSPTWTDEANCSKDCYKKLCTIEMDLSHLPLRPSDKVEGTGDFFYLEYGYILHFSAVELKAQISWVEDVSFSFYTFCAFFLLTL